MAPKKKKGAPKKGAKKGTAKKAAPPKPDIVHVNLVNRYWKTMALTEPVLATCTLTDLRELLRERHCVPTVSAITFYIGDKVVPEAKCTDLNATPV